jgi:phospholipid/cholesterol/gamma-HCH transport system permease protein
MALLQSRNDQWEILCSGNQLRAILSGPLDIRRAGPLFGQIRQRISSLSSPHVTLDMENVTALDDAGAIVLSEIEKLVQNKGGCFHLMNMTPEQSRIAAAAFNWESEKKPSLLKKENLNFAVEVGTEIFSALSNMKSALIFMGELMISLWRIFARPMEFRLEDAITSMKKTGVDAVPIVALISFLLGLIMAFMSSIQLRQFGANIYVASLVTLAMVSELGPIMTAIVVAGRSGSAFAAEIATMKISEEIDALYVMGFDTIGFLALPKIMAAAFVVPVLTLFSDLFAIAGGMVVGVFLLDITPNAYLDQTIRSLKLFELGWGLSKSFVFALLIGAIGCFKGFRAKGGADSVGDAATSAVVTSIFFIILFDSVFAVGRSFWK